MSKDTRRARRRHDRARKIAKSKRVYPETDCPQKLADNLAICSCYVCGNARRWWRELPMQWRRRNVLDRGWRTEWF